MVNNPPQSPSSHEKRPPMRAQQAELSRHQPAAARVMPRRRPIQGISGQELEDEYILRP